MGEIGRKTRGTAISPAARLATSMGLPISSGLTMVLDHLILPSDQRKRWSFCLAWLVRLVWRTWRGEVEATALVLGDSNWVNCSTAVLRTRMNSTRKLATVASTMLLLTAGLVGEQQAQSGALSIDANALVRQAVANEVRASHDDVSMMYRV